MLFEFSSLNSFIGLFAASLTACLLLSHGFQPRVLGLGYVEEQVFDVS